MPAILESIVFALACITLIPVSIAAIAQPVPTHLEPTPTAAQGSPVGSKEYAPPMDSDGDGDDHPNSSDAPGTRSYLK